MLTIPALLVVIALGLAIANAVNPPRIPLYISVLILCIAVLIMVMGGIRP